MIFKHLKTKIEKSQSDSGACLQLISPVDFEAILNFAKSDTSVTANQESGNWYVEGYASTSDLDLQGDIISPEAIKGSVDDLLNNSTVLFNHDGARAIGKVVQTKFEDPGRLWIKVLISKTAPDIWQQVTEGVLNKFSIRGKILNCVEKWSEQKKGYVNVVTKMSLMEVSMVPLPANPEAKSLRWYVSKALENAKFHSVGGRSMGKLNFENNEEDIEKGVSPKSKTPKVPKEGYSGPMVTGTVPNVGKKKKSDLSRSLNEIQRALGKISSGQLDSETAAEYAEEISRVFSDLSEDVAYVEEKAMSLSREKKMAKKAAKEKSREDKARNIASNVADSVKSELSAKIAAQEEALMAIKAQFDAVQEQSKSALDEIVNRFESLNETLMAVKNAQETLKAAEVEIEETAEVEKAEEVVAEEAKAEETAEVEKAEEVKAEEVVAEVEKAEETAEVAATETAEVTKAAEVEELDLSIHGNMLKSLQKDSNFVKAPSNKKLELLLKSYKNSKK